MPPPLVPSLDLSPIVAKQQQAWQPSSPATVPKKPSSRPPSPGSTLRQINFSYLKGKMIGRGAFGKVFVAINNTTGEIMAMKEFMPHENSSSAASTFTREIEIVSKLRHPHVVGYLGTCTYNGALRIFMEYCPAGSLREFLEDFGALSIGSVSSFTRQVLLGLSFLHHCGVAHRDVKGANVLIVADTLNGHKSGNANCMTLKLADFGSARDLYSETGAQHTSRVSAAIGPGTPLWSAPEVIRNEASSSLDWQRADVWSLGCLTLEMITAENPFVSSFTNSQQAIFHIANPSSTIPLPTNLTDPARAFLQSCLERDTDSRLTPSQILRHPFVSRDHAPPSSRSRHSSPSSRSVSRPSSPLGTPPLHMKKKANPHPSPQSHQMSHSSLSSASSHASQWTSSRKTPPVSPGTHTVSVGANSHNFLKPISARASSASPIAPTPPTSLINVLEKLEIEEKSSRKGRGRRKKKTDYEEERRQARRERRVKKKKSQAGMCSPSSSQGYSPAVSMSPSLLVDSEARAQRKSFVERSKSQSPGLYHETFQSKQLDFMEKLKKCPSPTQADTIVPSAKESPRVKSFRRKFPSSAKQAAVSEEVKSSISPIALESKLDESVDYQTTVVPSQAATIAKMWLEQARYAIQYYQSWEETWASWTPEQQQQYYTEQYGWDGQQHWDNGAWGSGGGEEYFDVYDYGYSWGEWEGEGDQGDLQESLQGYPPSQQHQQPGPDPIEDDAWEGVKIAAPQPRETGGGEDINEGWNTIRSTSPLSFTEPSPPTPAIVPTIVRAAATFKATDSTELSFDVDNLIAVTNEDASGWWYGFVIPEGFDLYGDDAEMPKEEGEVRGGWFPKTFVDRVPG